MSQCFKFQGKEEKEVVETNLESKMKRAAKVW